MAKLLHRSVKRLIELPDILNNSESLLKTNHSFFSNLEHPLRSIYSKVEENFSKYPRAFSVRSSQPERLSHFRDTECYKGYSLAIHHNKHDLTCRESSLTAI